MVDLVFKTLICFIVFLCGSTSFAASLSSISIDSYEKTGRIILDTDKSFINKKIISKNEMQIKLKNTILQDKLETIYKNVPQNTEISFLQKGSDAYINIFGKNIADYDLVYASTENIIPVKHTNKDVITIFLLFTVFITLALRNQNRKSEQLKEMEAIKYKKLLYTKSKISKSNTLRNQKNISNMNSIHGNPVTNFSHKAQLCNVTIPNELKNSNIKYLENARELKKVVNS